MHKTIKEVMTSAPHTIGLEQNVTVAKQMMRQHGVRHLPVKEGGELIGILTERDVNLALALDRVSPEMLSVADVYTPEPYIVGSGESVRIVAERMASDKLGCALVVDGGQLTGIFTTVDACRLLAEALR